MKYKLLTTLLILLIGVLGISTLVSASSDITIHKVTVDGVEFSDDPAAAVPNVISAERGSTLEIKVELSTTNPQDDIRVRTWIGGYEFDDVSDKTAPFDTENGVRYVKTLHLDIPEDIDVEGTDDDNDFILHVEAFGKNVDQAAQDIEFTLNIDKIRHKLNIMDVIFYPSNTVEPGRALRAVVRVENLGQQKEDDVLVRVSIPDLGISTRTYIDELTANEEDNEDDESSASSRDLVLTIPQDAKAGEYDVEVDVEYSRGHETVTKRSTILVEEVGGSVTPVVTPSGGEAPQAIISIDTTTQDLAQGSEALYKVMVANLGKDRILYSVAVDGEGAWGTSRVSPSFISVDSNQAGETFVYVKANENAPIGQQTFRVNVLSNGKTVKTLDLRANVVAKATQLSNLGLLKNGLEISFVILVVILIILGLIIAFRRVGSRESGRESERISDSLGESSQTYY
ncbi:hypothetical protein HYV88_02075 [Candidatus Woesearchaeota archaeon]|nr:hypothetical protein [Candidatus Woesearchaeota archaeon]